MNDAPEKITCPRCLMKFRTKAPPGVHRPAVEISRCAEPGCDRRMATNSGTSTTGGRGPAYVWIPPVFNQGGGHG